MIIVLNILRPLLFFSIINIPAVELHNDLSVSGKNKIIKDAQLLCREMVMLLIRLEKNIHLPGLPIVGENTLAEKDSNILEIRAKSHIAKIDNAGQFPTSCQKIMGR